jgi:periplasmic protein TonB
MLSIASEQEMTDALSRPARWPAGVSALVHASAFAAFLFLSRGGALLSLPAPDTTRPASKPPTYLVFVATNSGGESHGGGGGGNRQTEPIRRAEAPGHDAVTVRIAPGIALTNSRVVDALPVGLVLDAKPLASGFADHLGLPTGGVPIGTSLGPGTGGGVGTGTGSGIGEGTGPGVGPGTGGGFGGDVYRPGGAVTSPAILVEVKPHYTDDALALRIQGTVVIELVVTAAGLPANVRVVRSLDGRGLDEEAIKAVQQWRFRPGRLGGTPVNVAVTVFVDFRLY